MSSVRTQSCQRWGLLLAASHSLRCCSQAQFLEAVERQKLREEERKVNRHGAEEREWPPMEARAAGRGENAMSQQQRRQIHGSFIVMMLLPCDKSHLHILLPAAFICGLVSTLCLVHTESGRQGGWSLAYFLVFGCLRGSRQTAVAWHCAMAGLSWKVCRPRVHLPGLLLDMDKAGPQKAF